MKKILLVFISIFCIYFKALPQGSTCAQIQQYCGGNAQFQAPITGTALAGPAYGCLMTQPNPSWRMA